LAFEQVTPRRNASGAIVRPSRLGASSPISTWAFGSTVLIAL
jgi:hypothetical protein